MTELTDHENYSFYKRNVILGNLDPGSFFIISEAVNRLFSWYRGNYEQTDSSLSDVRCRADKTFNRTWSGIPNFFMRNSRIHSSKKPYRLLRKEMF